jgi:hypothetical protein
VPSTSTTTTTVQDGPSPTPPTIQQDQVEAAVRSMSIRHGRGLEILLTLLIQLLLLPLSRKTLDMLYLILIG